MKVERVLSNIRESLRNVLLALDHNLTAQENFGVTRAPAGYVLTSLDPNKIPSWQAPGSVAVDDDEEPDTGGGTTIVQQIVRERRRVDTHTTPEIAHGATDLAQIGMFSASGSLMQMTVSHFCRVRLYQTEALQLADLSRPIGTDPVNGNIVSEVVFDAITGLTLYAPTNQYYNADSPVGSVLYISVENRSGSPAAITVSITHRPEE